MSLEFIIAGAIFVSLTIYVLLGGADFGGGVWDLLASGPRAPQQRKLIADAIAPIWEANHVWLILSLVLLFVGFPPAFSVIMIALHVPLFAALIGIVLRGAAFTFRSYDTQRDDIQQRWGRLFAIASTLTPLMLGICVGAVGAGIRMPAPKPGEASALDISAFFACFTPFSIVVGVFALALFAYIAAVYLVVEANDEGLREDFRKRALVSAILVGIAAFASLWLSRDGAPRIYAGLSAQSWSWAHHLLTGVTALGAIIALIRRRYYLARALVVAQVVMIMTGWALAQHPYIVEPNLTIYNAASPPATLKVMLFALGLGVVIVVPSFAILFRIFKQERAFKV